MNVWGVILRETVLETEQQEGLFLWQCMGVFAVNLTLLLKVPQ
jgi:hypothetical protein